MRASSCTASLATLVVLGSVALGALRAHAAAPWSDAPGDGNQSRGEDLVIRLLTFGPGTDITEWFGHTAFVVEDHRLGDARLYNYGEFAFDEKSLLRYARGELDFWVAERPVQSTLEQYRFGNRLIEQQELDLAPAQRLALARALAGNVLPHKRGYRYDYFNDNCATRPRDVLDRILEGELAAQQRPGRMTLREHVRRYAAPYPPIAIGIDFLLAGVVDGPTTSWQEAFLPSEFAALVEQAVVDGHPLISSRTVLFYPYTPRPALPAVAPNYIAPLAVLGVTTALVLVLVRARRRARAWLTAAVGLCLGVPGTVLFVLATATEHVVTRWNENLLLANPLSLALCPLGLLGLRGGGGVGDRALRTLVRVLAVLGAMALVGKALPAFHQDNAPFLALVLPLLLGLVVAHARAESASRPS